MEGDYSICLNGHKLLFNDIDDWIAFESTTTKFTITNCKDNHSTSGGYVGAVGGALNHTIINADMHSGSIVLSSISFLNTTLDKPFININSFGTNDKFVSKNVYLENITMTNSENLGFINFEEKVDTRFIELTTGDIFNDTARKAADHEGSVQVSNQVLNGNVSIQKIRWSKTKPTNRTVYDISQTGGGNEVTNLSSVTDNQVLMWWEEAYSTIYLYASASYVKLNSESNNMFRDLLALEKIDMSRFDTSDVVNMESMYENCISLGSIDLSRFNTLEVENISNMFKNCMSLNNINLDSSIQEMSQRWIVLLKTVAV